MKFSHRSLSIVFVLGILAPTLSSQRALSNGLLRGPAAVDRPVTWTDMAIMDLRPAFRSHYASDSNLHEALLPPGVHDIVLEDRDHRISNEFHAPKELRSTVAFWLKIYTEYSMQQVVIYDRNHPDVIYDVLDFRDLAKSARNAVVYEIVSQKRTKAAVHEIQAALKQYKRLKGKGHKLTERQQRVLQALALSKHHHNAADLVRDVRVQPGQRDNVIKGLLAAENFFPKMEQIFESYEVPKEITRLSLVESSFNLNATSRVGASGVWQFMPKSAKEYMTINDKAGIDERLSPLKSTVAAAKLLRRSYKMLGHWALAITSYHHGYTGLRSIKLKSSHDTSVFKHFELCAKKSKIGWASRNYISEFLAVLHAEAYRDVYYGEMPEPTVKNVMFVKVDAPKSSTQIAMEHGVSLQEFRFLNPDIRYHEKRLPVGMKVALPGEQDNFAALSESTRRHKRGS